LGGATTTHAASTGMVLLPIETVAVTGPSDVSSYQSLALLKLSPSPGTMIGAPEGEPDWPVPPRNIRRPDSSVRISPSGTTVLPLNVPVLKLCASPPDTDLPRMLRGPGSIASAARSA